MKQMLQNILKDKDANSEKIQMASTVILILLFLTFWGVSFYVLVNSLA